MHPDGVTSSGQLISKKSDHVVAGLRLDTGVVNLRLLSISYIDCMLSILFMLNA